jgi:MtN3 and saliva related transmembrane protein
MFAVYSVGIWLWLVYGWLLGDLPLIVANGITFVLSMTILLLKIRFDRRAR